MVAIKDMEMPKACCECTIYSEKWKSKVINHCFMYSICAYRDTERMNHKPDDCPLVEIKDQTYGK